MKKAFLALILFALTTTAAFCGIVLPKGTILQVYAKKPISTSTNEEGDAVYFMNSSDVYSGEENIFPRNTIFAGYIEMLRLPIQGVNGAMCIRITQALFPDGTKREINAVIYHAGKTMLGGELTPPASYNRAVHKTKGWTFMSGVLQWVPSGEYEFGRHTTINTKDYLFILLEDDYNVMSE